MKIKIKQNRKNYKKDILQLYISSVFSLEFKIALPVYALFFLVFILNVFGFINFYPFLFEALAVSFGIGIIGMILYGLVLIFRKIKHLDDELYSIYEGDVYVNFKNDSIIVKAKGYINDYRFNWSDFKKVKKIKNTLHVLPKSQKGLSLRINKSEISEGDFDEVCRLVQAKLKYS